MRFGEVSEVHFSNDFGFYYFPTHSNYILNRKVGKKLEKGSTNNTSAKQI